MPGGHRASILKQMQAIPGVSFAVIFSQELLPSQRTPDTFTVVFDWGDIISQPAFGLDRFATSQGILQRAWLFVKRMLSKCVSEKLMMP